MLNRGIGYGLLALGLAFLCIGAYLGLFASLNDGIVAGLMLFAMAGAFGAALSVAGLAFRFAAAAHARSDPRRWWTQALVVMVGYVAFGLAAWTTSLLERINRP